MQAYVRATSNEVGTGDERIHQKDLGALLENLVRTQRNKESDFGTRSSYLVDNCHTKHVSFVIMTHAAYENRYTSINWGKFSRITKLKAVGL